ncbi:MAG: hypothetical protein IKU99_00075 [Clostridia bacterium]|nr:hypothetical protein [Clostridia bacterium]
MTQTTNNYDKLYENMKQRFTVSQNDTAYTLGEYMLMKADGKKSENTALPVAVMSEVAVTNIVSFIDDKLTIKQAPVKDKTIRAFPFRASASAFLTASVACAFLLSFVLIGAKSMANQAPVANDVVITETENSGVGFVEDLYR